MVASCGSSCVFRASDGQHLPTVNEIEPSLMRFLPKWTVRVSIFLKLTARNVKEPPADAEEEHRRVLFICSGRVELRSRVRKVFIFHSIEQRETNIYLLVVSLHFPTMHTANVPLDYLDVGNLSSCACPFGKLAKSILVRTSI